MTTALVATGCLVGLLVGGCEGDVADVPSDVRVSLQDSVLRCGPFDEIQGGSAYGLARQETEPVIWAPGDSRLAFAGETSAGWELWLLDPAVGTGACRLLVPASEEDSADIAPLTWSPEGDRLFAVVVGRQTTGRYKGKAGLWIVSVPAEPGRVRTVAFIRDWADWNNPPQVTPDGSAVVLTGEGIHRVSLESGKVTSWTDPRFEDFAAENVTFTSPGGAAVAWDTLGSSDPLEGAGVNVLDTRTGARVSIAPPPDLADFWYGLSGWSPDGGLLAVEFAGPEGMEIGEDQLYYPVGLRALVLYDAGGVERHRLTALREGWTIGDYAWSPDGTSLLYTQGTVELENTGDYGLWKVHNGRELWIWSRDSGKCQKLLDTSGAESVGWETSSTIYVPSDGWGVLELTRKDDTWSARRKERPWSFTYGEHVGFIYGRRFAKPVYQVLAVKDGVEIVVYEGPYAPEELWFGAEHLSLISADILSEEPAAYLVVVPTP